MEHTADFLFQRGALPLGLLVVIITFFVRLLVETAYPSLRKAAHENSPEPSYLTKGALWWNKVVLYIMPVATGAGLAAWKMAWFLPAEASRSDAVLVGIVIGWFSSFLYKLVRKILKDRTGIDPVPGPVSLTPDAPEEEPRHPEPRDIPPVDEEGPHRDLHPETLPPKADDDDSGN